MTQYSEFIFCTSTVLHIENPKLRKSQDSYLQEFIVQWMRKEYKISCSVTRQCSNSKRAVILRK